MFGVLLFCSFNGCINREGMLGGMVVEGMKEGSTGMLKGVFKLASSTIHGAKKAVKDGIKEGTTEGNKEKTDVDDLTGD